MQPTPTLRIGTTQQPPHRPEYHQWCRELRVGIRADKSDPRFLDWHLVQAERRAKPVNTGR